MKKLAFVLLVLGLTAGVFGQAKITLLQNKVASRV